MVRVPARVPRVDWVIFAAALLWAEAEAIFGQGPGERWERAIVGFAFVLPLIGRRRAPVIGLLWIAAVVLPWAYVATSEEFGAMPFPAMLLLGFSAGLYVEQLRWSVFGAVLPWVIMVAVVNSPYYEGVPSFTEYFILSFIVFGAWGAGRLIRQRVLQIAEAEAAGDELARDAVAEERARVARELHDVVGHSVGIIAMQAGAAEALIEKDPAQAREHMDSVRRTAQDTMREMRRLVQVLREDGVDFAPQPTLGQVEQLVEDARLAGVPAELEVDGERRDLPPAIDLAAYRIVQEALTNVRKHAGGADTTVRLLYGAEAVWIEVHNAAGISTVNGADGGQGLTGMRERVRIFGGEVDAAPSPGGGFVVRARLPIDEDARA
jgi:signal transduction histidine kinase